MPARELDDWIRYYQVEPWGAYRDNLHAGIIASVMVNRGRRGKKLSPADFVLKSRDDKRSEDTRRSLNYLRTIGVKRGG